MPYHFFENPQFLWGLPGGTEWILILLVVLLFFGGRKIPDLMRGLGRSVREFNEAKNGGKKIDKNSPEEKEQKEVDSEVSSSK
mgnify:CR=1 FL=1